MSPRTPLLRLALPIAAAALGLSAALSGCAPEPGATPQPNASASATASGATASGTASPTPSGSPTAQAAIPDDCAGMLSSSVASQLEGVPLNDPVLGVPTGKQSDGSLVCIWRDPAADTTYLATAISKKNRGPALDMLNQLADEEGYTCYTPDLGTRCEKTWPDPTYPVTDGRTLFWRDDILIDTQYSNLAPPGFTAALVASIWG
ncbi:hypothetical protein G5T42_03160 [Microbacterium sp. 4R-513]|uniref:hypothetical protein n=1 Tax=Microbacterium sp. 4R-513 TaxID=2567934 RepID=UPI0013E1D81C|nr:hypothetical protein [Microbacterium sp. 4R-513]QIG38610.1 hypothetical protein G5T42_03160 [Microbacterium sp. 4R-513]